MSHRRTNLVPWLLAGAAALVLLAFCLASCGVAYFAAGVAVATNPAWQPLQLPEYGDPVAYPPPGDDDDREAREPRRHPPPWPPEPPAPKKGRP
jgi:hypothetical protein